jgi:dTDP-4-amino-4,6-dideoxygalactose transaminase
MAVGLSVNESTEPIVFGAPHIGEEEIAEMVHTLRSGWLGTGPKTHQFEHQFANYVGAHFALGTNSGTAALHLALDALGVGPGDEVITTPLTFAATANVIEHVGATPVFVDVRPDDGNIDPSAVLAAVTDRTAAIIPVHYAGAVADVETLRAALPDMPIVVDAAHAVEAEYPDGTPSAGKGATATAYSFYATKNLVTGEGGMLVTDDEEIAGKVRARSLHGLDKDAWKRYASDGKGVYTVQYPGFKYNMTDMQASLGIHQLARIEWTAKRRAELWERYNSAFCDLDEIEIPEVARDPDSDGRHAKHLYTLWFDWDQLGTDRHSLMSELRNAGIGTGWHFPALHLQAFYSEKYGHRPGAFPIAEKIAERTLSLPMSAALQDGEAERVIASVRALAGRYV